MPTLLLFLIAATFRPAQPTVGDLITIDFKRPVTVEASADYEIVSQKGSVAVVRTFTLKPIIVNATAGQERISVPIRIHSVLKPKDDMKPAALEPPHTLDQPREPLIAIGIAALAAALAWAFVIWRDRRVARAEKSAYVAPADRFRLTVAELAGGLRPQRWATLADATREYLAAHGYGAELTTAQVLEQLHDSSVRTIVREVLHQGDLEKFSPWGAPAGDFDGAAARALSLIDVFEPPPATEAAA